MATYNNTYIDKFIQQGQRERYGLQNIYDTILIENKNKYFRFPFEDFFLKYKDELVTLLRFQKIDQKYFYKPKLLSLDSYGTTELWLSILRANGMRNVTEFHLPIIRMYEGVGLKQLLDTYLKRKK